MILLPNRLRLCFYLLCEKGCYIAPLYWCLFTFCTPKPNPLHIYILFNCVYKQIVIYLFRNKQEGGTDMLQTVIEMDKAANNLKLLGDKTRLIMMKLMDDHA